MDYFKSRGFSLDHIVLTFMVIIMVLFSIIMCLFVVELNKITNHFSQVSDSIFLYKKEVEIYQQFLLTYRKDCMPEQPHFISGTKENTVILPLPPKVHKKPKKKIIPVEANVDDTIKESSAQ